VSPHRKDSPLPADDAPRMLPDLLLVEHQLGELALPASAREIADIVDAYRLAREQVTTLYSARAEELLA
jgi:hypothetical protein